MSKLQSQLISPQSLVIEKTALELAATFYEAGRNSGMTSKHKDARSFARANVEKFIPKAVDLLMTMLGLPHVPQDQKDMIYDALMERNQDEDLTKAIASAHGKNSTDKTLEIPFISDYKAPSALDLALDKAIKEMLYGQVVQSETKN